MPHRCPRARRSDCIEAGGKVGEMRSAEKGVMQVNAADANEISGYGVNDVKSVEKDVLAVVRVTFSLN
jgi:uncharacterized protein